MTLRADGVKLNSMEEKLTELELKRLRKVLSINKNSERYKQLLMILDDNGKSWGATEFRICCELGIPLMSYSIRNHLMLFEMIGRYNEGIWNKHINYIPFFNDVIPCIREYIQWIEDLKLYPNKRF